MLLYIYDREHMSQWWSPCVMPQNIVFLLNHLVLTLTKVVTKFTSFLWSCTPHLRSPTGSPRGNNSVRYYYPWEDDPRGNNSVRYYYPWDHLSIFVSTAARSALANEALYHLIAFC